MRSLWFTFLVSMFVLAAGSSLHAQAPDTTITLNVKGITCQMDLKMIQVNVKDLKGVMDCVVAKEGPTSTFEVQFDPALVSQAEINTAIEGTASCEDPDERPYKVKNK